MGTRLIFGCTIFPRESLHSAPAQLDNVVESRDGGIDRSEGEAKGEAGPGASLGSLGSLHAFHAHLPGRQALERPLTAHCASRRVGSRSAPGVLQECSRGGHL